MGDLCDMAHDKSRDRYLRNRNGWWQFERRTPKHILALGAPRWVRFSLKTDSLTEARKRRDKALDELERRWAALSEAGRAGIADRKRQLAALAEGHGFSFASAADLAVTESTEQLLARVELIQKQGLIESEPDVAALLGGPTARDLACTGTESPPAENRARLSNLVDLWLDFMRDRHVKKSPNQMRKLRNAKRRVALDAIAVLGDLPLEALSRQQYAAFRSSLQDRIVARQINRETAAKYLTALVGMLRAVSGALGLPEPDVRGLSIPIGAKNQRETVAPETMQDVLLAPGALDGLNEEARRAVFAMVETGLRPTEIVNIEPRHIHLDAAIPFVEITPTDNRDLKTETSRRRIPLVGVSLEAFKAQSHGFPRYADKSDALSAIANKAIKPLLGVTLYSLRHAFEDRMIEAGADERMRCELMGHGYERPKYGSGPSLELKHELLTRMALTPPETL